MNTCHNATLLEITCCGSNLIVDILDFDRGYTLCHQFSLKDLQSAAEKSDEIECPKHQGYVPISQLVNSF